MRKILVILFLLFLIPFKSITAQSIPQKKVDTTPKLEVGKLSVFDSTSASTISNTAFYRKDINVINVLLDAYINRIRLIEDKIEIRLSYEKQRRRLSDEVMDKRKNLQTKITELFEFKKIFMDKYTENLEKNNITDYIKDTEQIITLTKGLLNNQQELIDILKTDKK